jgi:hypothetical protein
MIVHKGSLLNNKGFALVAALIIMLLLSALGSAAYMMTNIGFSAVTAERRYQLANYAADYALGAGTSYVIEKAECPPAATITPCASLASGASCSYFSVPDVTKTFCIIYAKGNVGKAEVMKTAVVPKIGSDWGGMVTRGGTITLSGSSAIAGCDDDENNYSQKCGMMPGLIAPPVGTNLSITSSSELSELCKTEGKMKGLFGNPPHYSIILPTDLTSKYFNVSDENKNGSAWDEFLSLIENKYGVDITPLPPQPVNSIPGTCKTEPDQFCCKTRNSTTVDCYNNSDCTGTVVKTIDLTQCRNGSNPDPQKNPIFIKIDASLLIQHNLSQGLTNPDLRNTSSSGTVTISTSLTNTKIVSGGTVKISLDSGKTMEDSLIFANNLNFDLKASGDRVKGGIFYAKNETEINATGGPRLGTVEKPILLLAGDTSMKVPGNLTINGLIYTSATNVSITGAVEIQGSLINNSTSANISNIGNGIIQFNKQVLDNLYLSISDLMNKPKCGGGNKKDWIANTKITLY